MTVTNPSRVRQPATDGRTKLCQECGRRYHRSRDEGNARWERRRYCSPNCAHRHTGHVRREESDEILVDNAAWLLDPTAPRIPIADLLARLGYTRHESLAKRLRSAGRPDLVEWLYRRIGQES